MIVVDANVIVALYIPGPNTALAEAAHAHERWAAPTLWRSEFRSALTKLVKAKLLELPSAQEIMKNAGSAMLCHEYSVRGEKVLEFAALGFASSYDCEYIVMADDFGVQLVTTDEPLIKHYPKIAIHLVDYVDQFQ